MPFALEKVKFILEHYPKLNPDFGDYSKIYLKTTENISAYFSLMDMKGKDILLPAASGEHLLNAYSYGAHEVTCFDINTLAFLETDLKVNIVKHLSLEDYLKFFETDLLNYSIYEKVAPFLKEETRTFFDYLYSNFKIEEILRRIFYYQYLNPLSKVTKNQQFLKPESYEALKDRLQPEDICYLKGDLFNLRKALGDLKFDGIITSNISDSVVKVFPENYEKKYLQTIHELSKHLKKDGFIQMAYVYDYFITYYANYFKYEKNMTVKNDHFEFHSIKGYSIPTSKDGVLVWKKAK